MNPSFIVQKGRITYGLGFNLFEIQKYVGGDLIYLIYLLLCRYNPMPHGKKRFVDSFANIWMVDYVMIIFAMVRYNKYEYLKQDVFPLEQQEHF